MYSGKLPLHLHHAKQHKGEEKWKVQSGCPSIGQCYASIIVDLTFLEILTTAIHNSIAPLQPSEKLLSVLGHPSTVRVSLFHEEKNPVKPISNIFF